MSTLSPESPVSATLPEPKPSAAATGQAARPVSSSARGWILGPGLDLLLVANLFWPLLVLWQYDASLSGRMSIQFWQIYFITTPHRWSTLALVLLDRQPVRARPRFFLGFAALVIVGCVGIRLGTGGLTCLLAVDYLWNAWHFAAQHHGIYRIYGRLSQTKPILPGWAERLLLRTFLLYCILRVAQVSLRPSFLTETLSLVDWLVPALPGIVVLCDLARFDHRSFGRLTYLLSVTLLFSGMLWAVHANQPAIVLALTTASAWFHASEYLAVIGWRLKKQDHDGSIDSRDQALKWIASRWAVSLLIFVVILGSFGWMLESHFLDFWLLINVIAAFLHYGYDGVLWKKQGAPSNTTAPSPGQATSR